MAKMIVNLKVEDYGKWKASFDEFDPVRRKYGCLSSKVFQEQGDPGDVVVITSWGSQDQARKYSQSPELKDALQKDGIVGTPSMYFVD